MSPSGAAELEILRSGTDWYPIDDLSAAGSARRAAIRMAGTLGFSETRAAEVGIVASEAGSNIHRHADSGAVGLQVVLRGGRAGVQILAIDRGPGMVDIALALTDGRSTGGTLGVGLGAIRRLATTLDLSSHLEPGVGSQIGRGTVLVAELWDGPAPDSGDLEMAAITRAVGTEEVCGDVVGGRESGGEHIFLLADGLGHGQLAADAAQSALSEFRETSSVQPAAVLEMLHRRLAHTRGAAVGIVALTEGGRNLRFAGAGNVSAFVASSGRRRALTSTPGIVGHQVRKVREMQTSFEPGEIMVMHSDGVREAWDLAAVPGLERRSAPVIAASLLRDFANRPDDASVLVVRHAR